MSNFKLASDYADKQEIISSLTLMDDLFMKVVCRTSNAQNIFCKQSWIMQNKSSKNRFFKKIFLISMDIP